MKSTSFIVEIKARMQELWTINEIGEAEHFLSSPLVALDVLQSSQGLSGGRAAKVCRDWKEPFGNMRHPILLICQMMNSNGTQLDGMVAQRGTLLPHTSIARGMNLLCVGDMCMLSLIVQVSYHSCVNRHL